MLSVKTNKAHAFKYIIMIIAVLIIIGFRFIPSTPSLSSSAFAVIGTFIGVLMLWLFVSIDWPSLLCILVLGTIDGLNLKSILSVSFGSDTFVFLLCTFICTYALSKTNIIKKIAIKFITNKFAKKGPWYFIAMFFASVIFIGMFVSPSVLFVMLLPILEQIYSICNIQKGSKEGAMLMMGMAFCVSISSGMTPIAHVFPILSMGVYEAITNTVISYGSYMAIAIPTGILLAVMLILVFKFILRPDVSKLKNINTDLIVKEDKKIDKQDIMVLCVFAFMILLWVLPSLLQNSVHFFKVLNNFGSAFPALIGVCLLCVLRSNNKPVLSISDACKNGVPFSALIMCAGTLALSSALTSDVIGLKVFLINNISTSLGGISNVLLFVIFALWAITQTNLSSNMVTATLVATVAVPVLLSSGGIVPVQVVIIVIGMLASFAFATPPSMPHIALAASSEWVTTKRILCYGSVVAVLSFLLAVALGLSIGILIF